MWSSSLANVEKPRPHSGQSSSGSSLSSEEDMGIRLRLFGVRSEVEDLVGVAFNLEIEPPVVVDAALPLAFSLVILLGVQAWVAKITGEKTHLLDECLLHRQGSCG